MITTRTLVAANRALALDETVCQESVVTLYGAEWLNSLILVDVTILPKLSKDALDNIGLVGCRGLVKDVEINAEPVVNGFVESVVLGA